MKYKIAVIEDEAAIRELYRAKLGLCGYDVKVARNGREGLELIEAFRPDLVLLDIRMPEMNGDEMLQHLRETDWGADIRVVILTNLSKDEAPSVLRFLSVDRYVVKAHHTPKQVADIVGEVIA
ncbi:MAG TPA: response regulator [Candidatus Saccharimonadales bacterium]|nr:response regulator [Candidatus Saccharimonadales bacterium]